MKDSTLEIISLSLVIIGLLCLGYIVVNTEETDIFFSDNTNKGFIEGNITKITYSEESGFSFIEVSSCKIFPGFYEGKINKTPKDEIMLKGSYDGEYLFIDEYK